MESAEHDEREGASGEGLPAKEQSPVASERQEAIKGDPGFGEGQEPQEPAADVDRPVASSAPPPQAQSGVPLAEDRAAGVEPGEPGSKSHESTQEAARQEGEPPEANDDESTEGREVV